MIKTIRKVNLVGKFFLHETMDNLAMNNFEMDLIQDYHKKQFDEFDKDKIDDDYYLCSLANMRRIALSESPSQSFFKVYSLIIVELNNSTFLLIDGTNSEPAVILVFLLILILLFYYAVHRWIYMC
jgi:hypothetical protein